MTGHEQTPKKILSRERVHQEGIQKDSIPGFW